MRAFFKIDRFQNESNRSALYKSFLRKIPTLALGFVFLAGSIDQAEARYRRHHHRQHAVISTHMISKHGGHKVARGGYAPPYAEIVYDVNAGKVLTATNPDALRHPASITKVMTLYLLFEQLEKGTLSLDSELDVSAHAASQAPSKLGLRPGSTIEVEDAIKAIVTRSANDVAVTIGENIAGSEDAFAEQMTRKARAIGMRNTLFRNASGLPDDEQVTTARDLATLGRVIQDRFPKYYKYFSTRSFAFRGSVIGNHNRLLDRVEGVDGIKTGYTRASGFNLLTSAKIDGHHVIAVVLGGRSGRARDNQMAALLETHMPDAAVGGRRNVQIAEIDDEAPPAPAPRVTALPVAAPVLAAPLPVAPVVVKPVERPRPAVVAEVTRTAPVVVAKAELPAQKGAIKLVPVRPNAAGATTLQVGATPPVVASTTPSGPGLRWIRGSQPRSLTEADPRIGQPTDPAARRALGLRAEADIDDETGLTTASVQSRTAIPVAETIPAKPSKADAVAKAEAIKAEAAPKPAPKVEVAHPAPRSGWIIQLAATDNEGKALAILSDAKSKNKGVLNRAESFTEKVQKGGAVLYRARFAGFAAPEAEAACKALKRSGYACFAQYTQF